jgi:hypothetical protein
MSFNNLSTLVGSRICLDLMCPIHAIGNGDELLIMEGHLQSSEISLISESMTNANTLIQFLAWSLRQRDKSSASLSPRCWQY